MGNTTTVRAIVGLTQACAGSQLSGGEQEMLAISRALITEPRLLILDDATEDLAPLVRRATRRHWPVTTTRKTVTSAYEMHWQLIIFDCDGVLVNSEPISNRIMAEVLTDDGLAISVESCYAHFMGRTMNDCVRILETHFGHRVGTDFVDVVRGRTLDALREGVEPVAGVAAALDRIAAPVCVASSGQLVKMRTTLHHTGLLHRFENRLFSAATMARGKPHPDIFLHAAHAMGAEPASCAVVEDSPVGVEAGVAAGMTVFGYAALCDAARLSAAGARVFTDMQALPALLEKGPAP